MTIGPEVQEAFEIIVPGDGSSRVLLTCEHASNRLPAPWTWPEGDRRLIEQHWAIDIGADAFTRDLADALNGVGVVARFTRLLVDPNRPLDSPTLFRTEADGLPVSLNTGLSEADRIRRIEGYYRPYHAAIDRCIEAIRPTLVLAIHSFTPVFEGKPRSVEIGVLHSEQLALAQEWRHSLAGSGMDVRVDEPYSGGAGFMYSPYYHALLADCPAIELEFRQDILGDPARRPELVHWVQQALRETQAEPAAR